jgi:hypothetical protein
MDALLIFLIVFYITLGIFALCAIASFTLFDHPAPSEQHDIELQERPAI